MLDERHGLPSPLFCHAFGAAPESVALAPIRRRKNELGAADLGVRETSGSRWPAWLRRAPRSLKQHSCYCWQVGGLNFTHFIRSLGEIISVLMLMLYELHLEMFGTLTDAQFVVNFVSL